MKLHELPVDCLLHLFYSKFSLQELFHLRYLSRHLCAIIESVHCIGRRRCLKIFWCFDDIPRYAAWLADSLLEGDSELLGLKQIGANDDDVRLCAPKCWQRTCVELARLLPHIQHLMVFFSEQTSEAYKVIPYLITRWRHSLRGLALFGTYYPKLDPVGPYSFSSMVIDRGINQLPCLISLIVCVENLFDNTFAIQQPLGPVRLDPPLVARLERLYFIQPSASLYVNVLLHLGTPCYALELDHLSSMAENKLANYLLNVGACATRLDKILNRKLPSRITSLRMSQDLVHLKPICARFTGLRSLVLRNIKYHNNSEVSLEQVLHDLRMLTQLTELRLVDFDFYVFELRANNEHFVAPGRLPVLPQVRSLTIEPLAKRLIQFIDWVYPLTQPDALFDVLGHVFPNIVHGTLQLAVIFRDEARVVAPIEPNRHFVHFRSMTRFTLYIGNGNYANLLSRHHRARVRRQLAPKWRSSARFDFTGFTGWQIWSRKMNDGINVKETNWTTNGAEMTQLPDSVFPTYLL